MSLQTQIALYNEQPETMNTEVEYVATPALDSIPDKAKVQVFLRDGTSFTAILRQSAGLPWVSVQGEPFSLAHFSPGFAKVKSIEVLSDKPSTEEQTRKYGEMAYAQPTTRKEYQDTLWSLAAKIRETGKEKDVSKPN